jgi:hypothetical protein
VREMTTPGDVDTIFDDELSGLPVLDARPVRVAEIRARCLAALARTRQRRATRRRGTLLWRARGEAVAAVGLASLFLAAMVERVLQILR